MKSRVKSLFIPILWSLQATLNSAREVVLGLTKPEAGTVSDGLIAPNLEEQSATIQQCGQDTYLQPREAKSERQAIFLN